jgi:hypothetical protein
METNMRYYQIDRTAEPEIIGIKTGTSQVELLESKIHKNLNYEDFEKYFSGYNVEFWKNQNKVFELNPPILKGEMRKNANLTDIMKYGSTFSFLPLLFSEKFIDILKTFNIGNYKTFDFEISNISELYHLLFVETIILEEINFDKSTIISGFKQLNNIKYHSIKNTQEYIEFKQKQPISNFETLVIPKSYFGRDIIAVQTIPQSFYSEKLIDFLLDCGITGLQVAYNNSIKLDFY